MSVFVDTSVWYAAADSGDTHNARACDLLRQRERWVTSDHVLLESWLLLRYRLGRTAALNFWQGLRRGIAQIESVTAADLEAAWAIVERYPDQDFSLTDCTSFTIMHRLGIQRAASFDDDFIIYRFGDDARRAFDVMR